MTERPIPPTTVLLAGLHSGQREIFSHPARFKVVAAGRRWGKTRLGVALALARALEGGRAWWVAPSYPMTAPAWRELKGYARDIPGARTREVERALCLPGGGWAVVKSADNPDSLRGEGLDLVILDEAAYVPEPAWSQALRPALSDRRGGALFISTPAGRNWFWRIFQDCGLRSADCGMKDGDRPAHASIRTPQSEIRNPDWQFWQRPTSDNPRIVPEEILSARGALPERVFRQEYLAEFLDDGGGVFRRVLESATAAPQESAAAGHEYIIGADWGRHLDFTVFCVLDATSRAVVALDRFNRIEYALQIGRLKALAERFRPQVIVAESNSMGEPLVEELLRDGLPVQAFLTTQASKSQAVQALSLALERGELRLLNDPALVGELLAYETERLPSGLLRYGAPAGTHDDCVMALALAWSGRDAAQSNIGFL